MRFEVIDEIVDVKVIARGTGIRIRRFLNATYGRGNWRKLKRITTIEYENGEIWRVELHWFEAHGIGRKQERDKIKLRRLR